MSKNHIRLDRVRWAGVRKAALERAGWRSELSGRVGKLECDHIKPLNRGGAPYDLANVQILTRDEHIQKTRSENRRPLTAEQQAWRSLLLEMSTGIE